MTTKDPKAFVTNEYLDDAVDTLLKGMGNMFEEQKNIMQFSLKILTELNLKFALIHSVLEKGFEKLGQTLPKKVIK